MSDQLQKDVERLNAIIGHRGEITIMPVNTRNGLRCVVQWRRSDIASQRIAWADDVQGALRAVVVFEESVDSAEGRICAICRKAFGADPTELGLRRTDEGYICRICG